MLWGESGSGKSCASLCVLDCAGGLYLDAGIFAEYRIQAMKGQCHYSTGYQFTEAEMWKTIRDSNLVVLDELGSRNRVSDHHYETVKRVMDICEEKPAIYVSNLSPREIARVYDDRVASRCTAGTIIEMAGDHRGNRRG